MLKRFGRSRSGLAAIEFALILPGLLLAFFGTVELSNALQAVQRVSQMATTTADLIAQESTVSNADEANVFAAVNTILYPFSTSGEGVVITSVIDDGHGGGKVAWSDAQNGQPRAVGSPVSLPTGIMTTGGSVILAEVQYVYHSPSGLVLSQPITLTSRFYAHPRRVPQIART